MAEREVVLGLAAEIVSAHVSNNTVPVDQLPGLIQQVFNTLAGVERASVTPPKPEPAVPIKQSVRADHLTCLDCGKQFSMLKRHLRTDHQLTPQEYRQALGIVSIVPDGRAYLCEDTIDAGEEDWIGTEQDRQRRPQGRWLNGDDRAAPPPQMARLSDLGSRPTMAAAHISVD